MSPKRGTHIPAEFVNPDHELEPRGRVVGMTHGDIGWILPKTCLEIVINDGEYECLLWANATLLEKAEGRVAVQKVRDKYLVYFPKGVVLEKQSAFSSVTLIAPFKIIDGDPPVGFHHTIQSMRKVTCPACNNILEEQRATTCPICEELIAYTGDTQRL